jgi:hypothetical protein
MAQETPGVQQKALKINLDARRFGTFAEIGAGQETARWFFHAGKAAGTVAKSISAYDMAVSDGLYGPTRHYVSRQRLEAMLEHEFQEITARLDQARGETTAFFVFADTAATHTRSPRAAGHSWLGVRFQAAPRAPYSEIIIHVEMLDSNITGQQEALGVMGVNLVYGAFYYAGDPAHLIATLMDDLSRRRMEVDMIKFSGPAFAAVDNRLMSLQLVEQGLSDAAMFTADGEVVQPSEVLSAKPVMLERGNFRPVTNVTLEMLDHGVAQLRHDAQSPVQDLVGIMEMTLNNLMSERVIDHQDFLARVDILGALGKMVMISNYTTFDRVTSYLRQYTQNWIGMVVGVPTLREILNPKYYADLEGGILEGLGRLFKGPVKLFVYPTRQAGGTDLLTARNLEVLPGFQELYRFLLAGGYIEAVREFAPEGLDLRPALVLSKIQSGEPGWEPLVPAPAAALIKQKGLFGFHPSNPAASGR